MRWSLASLLVAVLALPWQASAATTDWPVRRHDSARTGYARGNGNLTAPAVRWQYYVGGTLGRRDFLAADVNGDHVTEVVFIEQGRIVAKLPDDTVIWASELLGLRGLDDVVDLDGDGRLDVVTHSSTQIVVLAGADGSIEWRSPMGPFGNLVGTWITDIDGDHKPDVIGLESMCGTGAGNNVAAAWTFGTGFGATMPHWVLDSTRGRTCSGTDDTALADMDGDGRPELVLITTSQIAQAYRVTDASLLAQSAPLSGYFYQNAAILPGMLAPGMPGALVSTDSGWSTGGHQTRVLAYDASSSSIQERWSTPALDLAMDRNVVDAHSFADLDGNGTVEVVRAYYDHVAGQWTTEVRAATDGTVLAQHSGTLAAVGDLYGDGKLEVLIAQTATGELDAFSYSAGALAPLWALPGGYTALETFDRIGGRTHALSNTIVTTQAGTPAIRALVTALVDTSGNLTRLSARDVSHATAPAEVASYVPPGGNVITSAAIGADVTRMGPQLMVARLDGYLVVLDASLAATNAIDDPEIPFPGMRIGGFFSGQLYLARTPIVATLTTAPRVLAETSRGSVVCLDASSASVAQPPAVVWERTNAQLPTAVDLDGDGALEVVTEEGDQRRNLVATGADGMTTLWQTVLSPGPLLARAATDPLIGDVNGDGHPDVFTFFYDDQTNTTSGNVFDALTGRRIWATDFQYNWGVYGCAVGDINGDGAADALPNVGPQLALSGLDGASLGSNSAPVDAMPLVVDLHGDGVPDVYGSGQGSVVALDRSLSTLWNTAQPVNPYESTGAVVRCPDGTRIAQGSIGSAQFWIYQGADGSVVHSAVLAGGRMFATTADAMAAGVTLGALSNFSTAENLSGAGHPTALTGGDDGYLYALDPCAGTLEWSIDLGATVGEPIVADSNGDGRLDVIASTGDGLVVDVDQQNLPPPMTVVDTDPANGFTTTEAPHIESTTRLYAHWTAVPGATSYQAAVLTASGFPVRTPAYADIGTSTDGTITGLSLRIGARYRVAIRGVNAAGPGSEGLSPGILIVDTAPPSIDALAVDPATLTLDGDGGAGSVQVHWQSSDPAGLSQYAITLEHGTPATVVRHLDAHTLMGTTQTSAQGTVPWDGRGDDMQVVPAGSYEVHLAVTDSSGNVADARVPVTVAIGSIGPRDAGVPADAHDGGMDGGTMAGHSGCSCGVPRGGSSRDMWGLLVALGLVVRRRRR